MKQVILIKNGEIALKGLNRASFEAVLIKNIKHALYGLGEIRVQRAQSTITVEPVAEEYDMDEAKERLRRVFGIAAFSCAGVVPKELNVILQQAPVYLRPELTTAKTFKVNAKRADKKFAYTSPEICAKTGEALLQAYPRLRVDVHCPDVTVTVEIRDFGAYIHADQLPGAGGMPVGTGGKAAVLISGGIDSPVAAYMMAKRGIQLTAVHFASPPYTSQRAELKVRQLLGEVAKYAGPIRFATVPFTELQEQIARQCPEDLTTLIMRRYMMRIASRLAKQQECEALITGESIGQVASQTMKAIAVTEDAAELPVFRPLIGMDKQEIIQVSRKIGTFEISIQPFEDCCTVFTPKHPRTRPKLEAVRQAEQFENCDVLLEQALAGTVFDKIYGQERGTAE